MLGGARAPQPEPTPMPTPRGGGLAAAVRWAEFWDRFWARCSAAVAVRRPAPTADRWAIRPAAAAIAAAARLTSTRIEAARSGLPDDLDQASLQQAIEDIKKTLQIGRASGGETAGPRSDFESIIGQMFGKR